ncbi:MAG: hypothetical protein HYR96_01025 [Deltaproteobacteria bacterium]|nr:hypothetical protein [Deltaproteobacteria bacterium]MBI3293426.1 hypothetical protein [Deltaproteobacteria bacterium]
MKITNGLILVALAVAGFASAEEIDGRPIDLKKLPRHLEKSALFEFMKSRGMTELPSKVETIVQEMIYADASPARAYIPRGRSAQLAAADERMPRIVFTPHGANKIATRPAPGFENYSTSPGPDLEGRLYFGFAKRSRKGEGLSWNRGTGRFDYFVFTNMGGQGPASILEVTHREDCNKCHQQEAPIWVVPPWSEIINHDPMQWSSQPAAPKYTRDPILFQKDGVVLTEEMTPIENNGALAIDTAVSVGNRLLQSTRIIRQLCGHDLNCRRFILVAAMANINQSSYMRKPVVQTGTTGNDLADLDFINTPLNPIRALLQPGANGASLLPRNLDGFDKYIKAYWPKDSFGQMTQILPDPGSIRTGGATQQTADPQTARPYFAGPPPQIAIPLIYDVAFDAMGFTFQDSLRLQTIPLNERLEALELVDGRYVPSKLLPLLENWPPSREEVMAFYGFRADPEILAKPVPDSGQPAVSGLPGAFGARCVGCHSNQNGDVPFIPFNDPAGLKKYNLDNQKVIEQRLAQRNMPPPRVTARPSETEYQAMMAFFTESTRTRQAPPQSRGPVITNHLGVRYQRVAGLKRSYIVPSGVSIVTEGRSTTCGKGNAIATMGNEPALLVGDGTDGRSYLALENFPHFTLGNIVQVTSFRDDAGDCKVVAISRNGRLLTLGFSERRNAFGTIPYEADTTATSIGGLVHIAGSADTLVAVGKDGEAYEVRWTDPYDRRYTLKKITLDGVTGGQWLKVGISKFEGMERFVLESMGGYRLFLEPIGNGQTGPVLQKQIGHNANNYRMTANLLDKTCLMLVPGHVK